MIVYADLFLLINWIADFILLKIITAEMQVSKWRLIAAATTGSAGALLLLEIPGILAGLSSILLALLMIGIINVGKPDKQWKKPLIKLYGLGLLFGGFVYTCDQWFYFSSKKGVDGTIWVFLLWIFCIVICHKGIRWYMARYGNMETYQQLVNLDIYYQGQCVKMTAFIDTGNTLKESLTGYNVIVAEGRSEWSMTALTENQEHLYLIPYQTASCESACMIGFCPDKVFCNQRQVHKVIIAITKRRQLDPENRYHAIAPPDILK